MIVTDLLWLPDTLRDAGVDVVAMPGWEKLGNGQFTSVDAVTWHHDASAPGYSPGMPDYIRGQVAKGKPGANVEVTLDGVWHVIAAGWTYHAGRVRAGKPDSRRSIGVETDHTTGETWSGVVLLDSLRAGTAAIFDRLGHDETALEFHKTVCSPVGRKSDPDGLDLDVERDAVAHLMNRTTPIDEEVLLAWS